jgi:hypothetical protein
VKLCHACKKALDLGREVGRRDDCPFCHADLHCCLNCRFYDRAAPKQCREPVAEYVKEKARANFCDFFAFTETAAAPGRGTPDAARAALDRLFRK